MVVSVAQDFAEWPEMQRLFGFNTTILLGLFELPIKYYNMLLDSRVSLMLYVQPCLLDTQTRWHIDMRSGLPTCLTVLCASVLEQPELGWRHLCRRP